MQRLLRVFGNERAYKLIVMAFDGFKLGGKGFADALFIRRPASVECDDGARQQSQQSNED